MTTSSATIDGGGGGLGRRREIRAEFDRVGIKLSPDMLNQCAALASSLSMSPSALAESWEAHSMNSNVAKLTKETIGGFRDVVYKQQNAEGGGNSTVVKQENPNRAVVARRVNTSSVIRPSADSQAMVTPSPKKKIRGGSAGDDVKSELRPVVGPKYAERKDADKTLSTYVGSIVPKDPTSVTPAAPDSRCVIDSSCFDTNVRSRYRHGFTPLEVRAKALDDRLVEMGEVMVERYNLENMAPVGVPRQEVTTCVGRICNEAHEGRINRTSILLEGSRHHSGGMRVPLSLDNLTSDYSLFSGQIVAVEGLNASGRKLVANKVYEGASSRRVQTPAGELMKFQYDPPSSGGMGGAPLSVVTASGPFTTSDNLDYEPLQDLLNHAIQQRPHVVVLTGPFVDVRHPKVASGRVELPLENGEMLPATYEVLFSHKVVGLLEQLFHNDDEGRGADEIQTQVVLVPSLDDAIADNVFPQPPLMDKIDGGKNFDEGDAHGIEGLGSLGLHHVESAGRDDPPRNLSKHRRVHCLPNPCTFRVNEVVFGVTSNDVLCHICGDETSANLTESRLSRIAGHLLNQRSYYPLFPAPASSSMGGANLDLKHMDKWAMPCSPDVLVVPSRLTTFAKNVSDCVVINPGPLSKGTTGGTYARLLVYPLKRESLEGVDEGVEMEHGVHERVQVDIKKI